MKIDLSATNSPYGPLDPTFKFALEDGYATIVGPNNVGKSSALQWIFREIPRGRDTLGQRLCFIPADRGLVNQSFQPSGRTLAIWNSEWWSATNGQPLTYGATSGPDRSELARMLLNHSDVLGQLTRLNATLVTLGFPQMKLRDNQDLYFESDSVITLGAGLRSMLPVLAAMTDEQMRVIIIDEPETALEPRIQRMLKQLLQEWAEQEGHTVIVATHSHLFLNRANLGLNYVADRSADGDMALTPITTLHELGDVVFRLLGNSVEDLFFPGNYLVVEGASDQAIMERVIELLGHDSAKVKVVSAGGITDVGRAIHAVSHTLRPLVMAESPYKTTVVSLVDLPADEAGTKAVEEIRKTLGQRAFVLSESSIEGAIPEDLYARAGLVKATELAEIESFKGDRPKLAAKKRQVSTTIAAVMEEGDLATLPQMTQAAELAIKRADRASP